MCDGIGGNYECLEKRWCNPFKNPTKQIKGRFKTISLEMSDKAKVKLVQIPGKKLGSNCWIQIYKCLSDEEGSRCILDEEMKEFDTSASVETEEKYQWICLCYWNFSTENKRVSHYSGKVHLGKRKISSAMQKRVVKTKNQDVYQMRKWKSLIQVLLQKQKRNINECFSAIGISPLKTKEFHITLEKFI